MSLLPDVRVEAVFIFWVPQSEEALPGGALGHFFLLIVTSRGGRRHGIVCNTLNRGRWGSGVRGEGARLPVSTHWFNRLLRMYRSVQNATHLQKCAASLPVDYWIPADVALPVLNPES